MRVLFCAVAFTGFAVAQPTPAPPFHASENAPIYHVTVVQRSIQAVNYLYRQGPTQIDFKGTILLPDGKGSAIVESRQGRTGIDANVERLKPSQSYGREYLTYVLWAITPEGRPHNLGEIVPGHSDKGHLHVTTDLQAFAMIVTAEPYSAVRQPSDVVVLENQVRPDTAGSTETVNAKYELLPRGQYTWNQNTNLTAELAATPKVSMREYETLTELYQAENAVGIAQSAGAPQYAPETFARAQDLLQQARQMHYAKAESHSVIEAARQAAQTAEDARLIAADRKQQALLNTAQTGVTQARAETALAEQVQQTALQAQADAQARVERAQQEAQAANDRANQLQKQLDQDHAALLKAQTEAAQARQQARQTEAASAQAQSDSQQLQSARQSALRVRLLEDLNGVAPAMDTPRGLVVTIPGSDFTGDSVHSATAERIARVASILARQPELSVSVQGYSDIGSKEPQSEARAFAIRHVLTNSGLNPASVTAKGFGDSRPTGPAGQAENTRVEIVITGAPIGAVPFWDRTYSLSVNR